MHSIHALPNLSTLVIRAAKIAGTTLCAVTCFAAPASADVLTFSDLANYGAITGGTTVDSGAFRLGFYANNDTNGVGRTVGQFVTPGISDCPGTAACPVNNPGTYYAALNAGILDVVSLSGATISVAGFAASFIGSTTLSSYPALAGKLGIQGITADGQVYFENYFLPGPGTDGFAFSQYQTSAAFASLHFVDVIFFTYVCGDDEVCSATGDPSEQFALDNVELNVNPFDVPEPASIALFGLGLAGLAAIARRRR